MIRVNTYERAAAIVASMVDDGRVISAAPNTPLAELVRHSSPFKTKETNGYSNTADDSRSMAHAVNAASSGFINDNYVAGQRSLHDVTTDGIGENLRQFVKKHLSFARSVVKPTVLHFEEKLLGWLESNRFKDPSQDFELELVNVPELLSDDAFVNRVNQYAKSTAVYPSGVLNLAARSFEDIQAVIQTGSSRFDALVAAWFTTLKPEMVQYHWHAVFANGIMDDSYFQGVQTSSDIQYKMNWAIMTFLSASKLRDNPAASEGTNLFKYQTTMDEILAFSASLIVQVSNRLESYRRARTLVINADRYNKKLTVFGEVYNEWSKGSSVDVLMGLLVSTRRGDMTVDAINANAQDYLRDWNAYCTYSKSATETRAHDAFRRFVEIEFYEDLKNLSPEEQDFVGKNSTSIEHMKKYLHEELKSITREEMSKPGEVALRIIGKCRFYYSSAYGILSDINEAGRLNPKIDVREAALFAATRYLSKYMTAMMVVR